MIDRRLKIWFFKQESFNGLNPILSSIFDCNLKQDYENFWEWMEGFSEKYQADINISRAHENWTKKQFANPVMILFNPQDLNIDAALLIKPITKALFEIMHTEIYYGYLTITGGDKFEYLELGRLPN